MNVRKTRSGQSTVNYWKAKLFTNSFSKNGITYDIPEYYVRLRYDGITKKVRLHTSDKDEAAQEALMLFERLSKEGWNAVRKGQSRLAGSFTIEEFCESFKNAVRSMDDAPRSISVNQYIRHLRQICSLAGITRLQELTPQAIEKARDKYKALGREANRSEASIQNSLGIIIRNAAACFSKKARVIMERHGLSCENPFAGIPKSQRIEPVAAISEKILARIWSELPLLRDGDPKVKAKAASSRDYIKIYRKTHNGKAPRWLPIDYSKPHPEAYCAILLALGLGLRANEIDKARWSWIKFDSKGDCIFEVRKEIDFTPKGGSTRFVRMPVDMYTELEKARTSLESTYILGGTEKENTEVFGYRRRSALRIAAAWLRDMGVETGKLRGNPLHRLRKQFGSEVATSFGLFQAQKLLGHSSPTVTAKYYAAQTNLPDLTHVRILG
jgi:integrase